MRLLALGVLLLTMALAGCTGPGGNPNLRPPCVDSQPVRLDVVPDKDRYFPGEVMNVTLVLNNTGSQAQSLRFRSWELSLKSFDGRSIRTFLREADPDVGGGTRSVAAGGRTVVQERFQPFRVTQELYQPLTPGTYYLCAVMTGAEGNVLATGARPFLAERPPDQRI